jgi:hypothetical protein
MRRVLDQPHLTRQRLQPAEAAGWFGLGIDEVLQRRTQALIDRFDNRQSE